MNDDLMTITPTPTPAAPPAPPPDGRRDPLDLVRLDAAAVCRRLAIGPRRLYQLVAEGRFPAPDLRLGANGRRLWTVEQVAAWESAQHAP